MLDRVEAADALKPKRIHLNLKEARLAAALRALTEQSGVSLVYSPQVSAPVPKPLTLELDGVPFWEALDRLCSVAGLVWFYGGQRGLTLTDGKAAASEQTICYAGSFRFLARAWGVTHNLSPSLQPAESLTLSLEAVGEPSPDLLGIGSARLVEARTTAGNSLPAASNIYPYIQPVAPSRRYRSRCT